MAKGKDKDKDKRSSKRETEQEEHDRYESGGEASDPDKGHADREYEDGTQDRQDKKEDSQEQRDWMDRANKEHREANQRGNERDRKAREAAQAGLGDYGTVKSEEELANEKTMAEHAAQADLDWEAGDYASWASNKIGETIDSLQSTAYEEVREFTQAPLDKFADIARSPLTQGVAMVTGGLPAVAGLVGFALTDTTVDFFQGEKTGEEALQGAAGDAMGLAPPELRTIYNLATEPVETISTLATAGIPNPIVRTAFSKIGNYAGNQIKDDIANGTFGTEASPSGSYVNNPSLSRKRESARQETTNRQLQMIQQGYQSQFYQPQILSYHQPSNLSIQPTRPNNFLSMYAMV